MNYSTKTNYLERQMFLDPAGGVTIQRFEEVKYPKLQKFEAIARGYYWDPEEITLVKDKADHKNASKATQFIFTENILRQSTLDSLQGRAPIQIFGPVASVPEVEALASAWSFFECNIHSNSYSHIIRNIYQMPKEQFDSIHDNAHIVSMAANIAQYYQKLHILNCKKEIGIEVNEEEHIDAIWLALNASYALEALRFMVSFATSLAMVENKIYMGNGNIISLILQDELLHTEWTEYLIKQVVKDDPRFVAAKIRNEVEVMHIYNDTIREEKEWADHLMQFGPVVGLNADILKTFVDFTATYRLKNIGLKYTGENVKNNPIPWFDKHTNLSKKQVALQEQESTEYILNATTSELDYGRLPKIQKNF